MVVEKHNDQHPATVKSSFACEGALAAGLAQELCSETRAKMHTASSPPLLLLLSE
jgi:hypothetical protein